MVMRSDVGFTFTATLNGALGGTPATELVATTEKLSTMGVASGGTLGVVKVCIEPSPAPAISVMPAGAVQVKVRVPPFGSTPVALSVTMEVASPTTGFGVALADTPGGVFGG